MGAAAKFEFRRKYRKLKNKCRDLRTRSIAIAVLLGCPSTRRTPTLK